MGKLTALAVKNAKPGRHPDGKGLYLYVKPTGSKSWVLRVVVNGRRRDFGLGPVDLVTLQEARDKAIEGRRLARAGVVPSIEWKRAAEEIPTFADAARQYHGIVKGGWRNRKHGDQWLSTLEAHAFPLIGAKPIDQIDASAIQSVLLPIWLTLPETARRVRQRIATVLDYAKAKGWRETEAPMRAVNALMRGIKQPKGGSFAAMPYADLPAFMAKLRAKAPSIGGLALQFTILTAARSGEVRGAQWDEIDMESATWNIPAGRMKAGEPHSIPLSDPAMDILRQVAGLVTGRKGELVFPGSKGKPLSDMTLTAALKRAGGEKYTVHGFRSAFRDWGADLTGFSGDWLEAALAHAIPNKVEAAYRRTKFLDQRRSKVMPAWADYVLGNSNVIALAERRA